MSQNNSIPTGVLSQQLADLIGGRRVNVAVFTTFTFDPGFFELHVLPLLFDQSFSQVDKVRRIQLEDALRTTDEIAVYYDRGALAQEGESAQLDYRRIDVRRNTGVFHPKLIFLLVEPQRRNDTDAHFETPYQSLIVGTLSANLTRAGWWENLECAHFEELGEREVENQRCPFRSDLLSVLRRVRDTASTNEEHSALDKIRRFVLTRTNTRRFSQASSGGRYYTRLFHGQGGMSLTEWLNNLRLSRHNWNLEIISPFFDDTGAGPLEDMIETLNPRETRVYLPRDLDGSVRVTEKTYDAVSDVARWGILPDELVQRGRSESAERLPPRNVHAKVYRFWSRNRGHLLLVGSPNLTWAAHTHSRAGNLEAAFLIDMTDERLPQRWWLDPLDSDTEIAEFKNENPSENEGLEPVLIDLSLRYDWLEERLYYRLEEPVASPLGVAEVSGRALFHIESPRRGSWITCSEAAAQEVRKVLFSTSFLLIRHSKGEWRVLVREENMGHRPSLLTHLTPEEILEYWSLLTAEQRAIFIEARLASTSALEGLPLQDRSRLISRNTMFDRFAGIFHSFNCLQKYIEAAIEAGHERDADTRLFGAKYDSLPALLEKTLAAENGDPVSRYLTFLCARQVRDSIRKQHRDFFRPRRQEARSLDALLSRTKELRELLELPPKEKSEFLDWFETMFLAELKGGR